ncbi:MAG: CAP domain-containing protein [Spirochaetes bacterium]|nr:CAP domain-containing protein [Spirochaetota bacterium]MBX3720365.1 CAP domain-containing protein [Turneriella sp.]
MKKILLIAFIATSALLPRNEAPLPSIQPATSKKPAGSVCLTSEEKRLVDIMNDFRRGKGLPALAATRSMSYVAKTHAADLAQNNPASGMCNMHSWSSRGPWSPCCYTSDHAKANCMWKKPQELSDYRGSGFEISSGSSGGRIDAATALRVWQGSSGHNAVIINQGMWNKPWRAFGVGISGGYAVAWFGNEADPMGEAVVCK